MPVLGAVQASLVFIIGLRAASRGSKGYVTAISVLGYLMGAEVLWRALALSPWPPYEGGKYAAIVIATVGIIHRYRTIREWSTIPFLYLLCLLPSALMLLGKADLIFARQAVIYHLAGPIALGLCSIYFTGISLRSQDVKEVAKWGLAPVMSISALALYSTLIAKETGNLYFGMSSNMITSGEFGPNQVSNTLALGALICWLWVFLFPVNLIETAAILGIMSGFTAQILLTFSRGGAYVLGLCILSTIIVQFLNISRSPVQLGKGVTRFAIVFSVFIFIVWPWIDKFTYGALTKRYTAEDTNRMRIISTELEIWRDYPVLGIGPGRSNLLIKQYAPITNKTHTEFTRLLAEHGMFGAMAISLLISGVLYNYRKNKRADRRVWIASCATYTFLYMAQAATRTVAPTIMYALMWTQPFSDQE